MATKRKTKPLTSKVSPSLKRLKKAIDLASEAPSLEEVYFAQSPGANRWRSVNDPRDATELLEAEQKALRQKVSEVAPHAVVSSDVELQSMTICVNALDSIPWLSRRRAVHYLYLRYVTNSDLEPPPND